MELITLNPDFTDNDVVDSFEAAIWTERYTDSGSVTVSTADSFHTRKSLAEGTLVALPESREIMLIESMNAKNGLVKATGPSLATILAQRILRNTAVPDAKSWELTGSPGWIMCEIVRQMCISGGIMDGAGIVPTGTREMIPNLAIGNIADGDEVTIAVEYGQVLDAIKKIATTYSVGFSLYLSGVSEDGYNLVFETYNGTDRTSDQSIVTPVIFEPSTDSLANSEVLRSIAGWKNVAYAWAPSLASGGSVVGVAYQDASELVVGIGRRTLLVNSDINELPVGTTLQAILNQKAKDALANNNYVKMVDGEVVPQLTYTMGVDYSLGDIIELRNDDQTITQKARITEIIRSQDDTGERAYPTLSVISE